MNDDKKLVNEYREIERLLYEYAELDAEIECLNTLIESENIKAVTYSDMPKGNNISNPTEQSAERLEELLNELKLLELKKRQQNILLSRIKEEDKRFIKYKYFDKMTYSQIASKMNYHPGSLPSKKDRVLNRLNYFAKKLRLL